MKLFIKTAIILASLLALLALSNEPALAKAAKAKKAHQDVDVKPSRDLRFDDALVQGKYHEGSDGLAVIENEKNLNQILFVKKSFRNRTKELAEKGNNAR